MIQAHELRIGNYVFDALGNITQITPRMIVEQSQSDIAKVEYLKPIPLTEEWLLKFGFKHNSSNWLELKYHTDCEEASEVFVISYNLTSKRFAIGDVNDDTMIYTGKIVDNVHVFQNGCEFITGKELIVK